jgi:hypothetical protein
MCHKLQSACQLRNPRFRYGERALTPRAAIQGTHTLTAHALLWLGQLIHAR